MREFLFLDLGDDLTGRPIKISQKMLFHVNTLIITIIIFFREQLASNGVDDVGFCSITGRTGNSKAKNGLRRLPAVFGTSNLRYYVFKETSLFLQDSAETRLPGKMRGKQRCERGQFIVLQQMPPIQRLLPPCDEFWPVVQVSLNLHTVQGNINCITTKRKQVRPTYQAFFAQYAILINE